MCKCCPSCVFALALLVSLGLGCDDGGGDTMFDLAPDPSIDAGFDTPEPSCDGIDCGVYGDCAIQDGEPVCVCDEGYSGNECGDCDDDFHLEGDVCVENENCEADSCSGSGDCDDSSGVVICECDDGYTGDECEDCDGGYHPDGAGDCVIDEDCIATSCSGFGLCDDSTGVVTCDCDIGYTGSNCGACDIGFVRADDGSCDGIPGLVAFYPFSGDANDASGNESHGTVFGASLVADRFGNADSAYLFDAVDERIVVDESNHPTGEVTASYAIWVNVAEATSRPSGLLAAGDVLEVNKRSSLVLVDDINCVEYAGEGNDSLSSVCPWSDRWNFVVATKAGRDVRFYLNGRRVDTGRTQGGQDVTNTQIVMGLSRYNAPGDVYEQYFGALDDVRVFNRALTEAEIDALFREGGWDTIGRVAMNPGASCQEIGRIDESAGDGLYWIDPDGAGTDAPYRVFCDMSTLEGGWTLAWSYGFASTGALDGANGVTPIPSWTATGADATVSTVAPLGVENHGAIDFDDWSSFGSEFMVQSNINDWIVCAADGGSLVDEQSGALRCGDFKDVAPACFGISPTYLNATNDTGPSLHASSENLSDTLYYYWDGEAGSQQWPVHDPCGQSGANHLTGVDNPYGAVFLRESLGRSADLPGRSCQHIMNVGSSIGDGLYWIDLDGRGGIAPFEAYCDMTTAGGGWTLVYAYTFAHFDDFVNFDNAVTPRPSWQADDATVPVSTVVPQSDTDFNAMEFGWWPALGSQFMVKSNINDWIMCDETEGSLTHQWWGNIECTNIKTVAPACTDVVPNFLNAGEGWTGPSLYADDLYYYWDGSQNNDWPTHDPCGVNRDYHIHDVAQPWGAIYLREPAGFYPMIDGSSCLDILEGGRSRGDGGYWIDPDGTGDGAEPFQVFCDMESSDGGWTQLRQPYLDSLSYGGLRQYLYAYNGAWYRSPPTRAIWDWNTPQAVEGPYYWGGANGSGWFDCLHNEESAWGVGCSEGGGAEWKVFVHQLAANPIADPDNGRTTICQDFPDAFQVGACVDDVQIYERAYTCEPDAGSMINNGGFDDGFACWMDWGDGLKYFGETDFGSDTGVPYLRVENNSNYSVAQYLPPLIAGNEYRLSFRISADADRMVRIFVQECCEPTIAFFHEDLNLTNPSGSWQYIERTFTADVGSTAAYLEFQHLDETVPAMFDDIRIEDLGPAM